MARAGPPRDPCRKIRLLGEGGAGRVWLVRDDRRGGREVALKELIRLDPAREEALRREFATLRTLRHPNLAEVHEFDADPATGHPRFTLEYVDGMDLVATVRAEGHGVLIGLVAEALRALAFLHDLDILHRDLKPGNLLVRRRERHGCRLVVLDFGLAVTDAAAAEAGIGGTLPYLAPELLAGGAPGRRSDLWGLGAVVHEAIYGAPPSPPVTGDVEEIVDRVAARVAQLPPVPPGLAPALRDWLGELLAVDPARRPAGAAGALARLSAACGASFERETRVTRAARLASGAPPGREEELENVWRELRPGERPRLVLLCGEAGSGKTRVLRWLSAQAIGRGWEVQRGPPEDDAALEDWRARAARVPTLVLIDELERAGPAALERVERIAREPDGAPVQVVAALRPAELGDPVARRLLADVAWVPALVRVELAPLDATGVAQIVERATGSGGAAQPQVAWLLEASEGNPLLLETLLVEGAWERGGKPASHPTLEASITRRVEGLEPEARRWLEALAVLGSDASEDGLAALSDLDEGAARSAAEGTALVGLARSTDDGRWSPASRVVAGLLRERLAPARSRELHRRAGEWLGPSGDPARLARLWRGAGDAPRSIAAAIDAAGAARAARRFAEAAGCLAFAIVQLPRRDPRRRALRLDQAEMLMQAARHDRALPALATALRATTDLAERCAIRVRLALARFYVGDASRALDLAERTLALARALGRDEIAARAERVRGMALFRLGREAEAIPLLLGAATELERCAAVAESAACLHVAGLGASRLRRFDEAQRLFERAIAAGRAVGDHGLVANALVASGVTLHRAFRVEEALRGFERARQWIDEHALKSHRAGLLSNTAAALCESGRWGEALRVLAEATDLAVHLGSRYWWTLCQLMRGATLTESGRPGEAAAELETALGAEVEVRYRGYIKISLAEALAEHARPDRARIARLLEEATRETTDPKVRFGALVVRMERAAVDGDEAGLAAAARELEAAAAADRSGLEPPLEIRAALAAGHAAAGRGETQTALEATARALEIAERYDLPALAARAWALRGEAAEASGRPEQAEAALRQARERLERAAARIGDEALRRDFLARPVFRTIRDSSRGREGDVEDRRVAALYDMIRALNSETDPELLLESILDMALVVVQAERGLILLREADGEYAVRLARNLERQTIDDAAAFSRNIVLRAGRGRSVLAVDTATDPRLRELKSVSLFDIRSVLCVPLRSRGEIVGAVYLDSRGDGTAFTPADLRFLEAFADHAALALENARIRHELELENRRLQAAAGSRERFGPLVGRSAAMQQVYDTIERVCETDLPVLILGESGTGKELVARAVHERGPRKRGPFVSENCAALPETLLESELFGHVRGAFTGAERDRAGVFEQADGGTLFLDEVGDMPQPMQARLLRVLEEGELRRVGGERRIRVDVRVVAATHRDLARDVAAGAFREDLLYRLQVLVIELPPLRERHGDVPLLVEHFLRKIGAARDRPPPALRADVLALLERYPWPGNVRQLENHLQRLVLLAGDGAVTTDVVASDRDLRQTLLAEGEATSPVYSLADHEREQIRQALEATGGNRTQAAKLLGISRATIFRKIKAHRLA